LASTTHDTKRSEDVRARLALLSEIPKQWAGVVHRWAQRNRDRRSSGMPDPNTEYLFYQTLVGAWPIDTGRMTTYMEKAVREAKKYTSWTQQDDAYEQGVRDFVEAVLGDAAFCAEVEAFVSQLRMPGRVNSLAQTLIKLTAPGVPDIYQGTELWELSLVDPDNRRPVDFALRRRLLKELDSLSPEEISERWEEGLPKLWLIRQALHLRRRRPELFGPQGEYSPVFAQGARAGHVMAFVRGGGAVSVAPRLCMAAGADWGDTALRLPAGRWQNLMTREEVEGGKIGIGKLLGRFPVGLLEGEVAS
jgi:(1->4)-alpha-D-glucan 1-alpha-D-glucosylmutase